jgi:RND family efflux transporter MFP subunit
MRLTYLLCLCFTLIVAGCRNNQNQPAEAESGHSHGAGSVPYTAFSDSCEYFAEIKPIVKGLPTDASIHITHLSDYKPLAEGVMAVRVLQDGRLIGSGDTNKPRIPGIFPVKFTASSSGNVSLQFIFNGNGLQDSVTVPSAIVFENEEQAKNAPPVEDPAGVIKFTKEMAWKIDFSVLKVVPREYLNTFKVSGELAIPPSEVTTVNAKSDGILVFRQADLIPGARVTKGSVLFTLTGQGLTSRNMDASFAAIKSRFESSWAAYEREKPLVKDQIVSQKQFNETMTRFRIDSTQYFTYLNGFSGNTMNITATEDGYIQQVFQSNGAFVTEGTPLVAIGNTTKILLRADLPQRYWQDIPLVRSASFRPAGSSQVYDMEAMGGKLVAKGSAVSADNQFIPVSFEFPNKGSFVAGTFAEVFLHTTPLADQIVIPVSALMEEQGNYYVYVQLAGESFLKKPVTIGFIDGLFVNIAAGLKAGDRVVTRGVIFIKASSQMTGTPSHGHEH